MAESNVRVEPVDAGRHEVVDLFTERLARATVALAVFGSATVLGVIIGAVAFAVWPSTVQIVDQAIAALLCLGAAGWWFAAVGRRWMSDEATAGLPRRFWADPDEALRRGDWTHSMKCPA